MVLSERQKTLVTVPLTAACATIIAKWSGWPFTDGSWPWGFVAYAVTGLLCFLLWVAVPEPGRTAVHENLRQESFVNEDGKTVTKEDYVSMLSGFAAGCVVAWPLLAVIFVCMMGGPALAELVSGTLFSGEKKEKPAKTPPSKQLPAKTVKPLDELLHEADAASSRFAACEAELAWRRRAFDAHVRGGRPDTDRGYAGHDDLRAMDEAAVARERDVHARRKAELDGLVDDRRIMLEVVAGEENERH